MSKVKHYSTEEPFLQIANVGRQTVLKVRQATEQGYIECLPGGVCDLAYPSSYSRRARVTERGNVSGSIMAGETSQYVFVVYEE